MLKSHRGFGLVSILLILIVLIGGAIGVFFILKKRGPISKRVAYRQHGKAKNAADGTIDTPVYADNIASASIGQEGGVISIQLKSGAKAYLIVPPDTFFDVGRKYVEVSEFKELPTSAAHLPLSTDLGFGLNISFSGYTVDLQNHPVFLVWDFSSGEQLKAFQGLAKNDNHCDYSKETFQPEICAALLNIPIDQTLNKKYLAAEPKYSDEGSTPTFAAYSYYLSDRLLINRITDSTVIVPQPAAMDLVEEMVKSYFGGRYGDSYSKEELKDLIRNFGLSNFDPNILLQFDPNSFFQDFKSLADGIYMANLIQSKIKEGKEQDVSNLQQTLDELQKYNKERPEVLVSGWGEVAALESSGYYSVVAAANLRRAYDAKMKNADKMTDQALDKIIQNLSGDSSFDENTFYAFETAVTLLGKNKYVAKREALLRTINNLFLAEAEASAATQYDQLADLAKGRLSGVIGNADLSLRDMLHGLALAQLFGLTEEEKKLFDLIQNTIRQEIKKAERDDEKIDADKHCHLFLDDSECGGLDEEVEAIFVKMCHSRVVRKTLRNFGDQRIEMPDGACNFAPVHKHTTP